MAILYVLGLFGYRVILKAKQYEADQSTSTEVESTNQTTGDKSSTKSSLKRIKNAQKMAGTNDTSLTIPTVTDPTAGAGTDQVGTFMNADKKNTGNNRPNTDIPPQSTGTAPSQTSTNGCLRIWNKLRKKRTIWMSIALGCASSISTIITFYLLWNGIQVSAGMSLDISTMVGATFMGAFFLSYACWIYFHVLSAARYLGALLMGGTEFGMVLLALKATRPARLHPDVLISNQMTADSFELLLVIIPLTLSLSILLLIVNVQTLNLSRTSMSREMRKKNEELEKLEHGFRFSHLYVQYLTDTIECMKIARLYVDRIHAMENPWLERYRTTCREMKTMLEIGKSVNENTVVFKPYGNDAVGTGTSAQEMSVLIGGGRIDQKEGDGGGVLGGGAGGFSTITTTTVKPAGHGKKGSSAITSDDDWIRQLMEHPIAFSAISEATVPNRSPENLAFLEMARRYRTSTNDEKKTHLAYVMYDTFISNESGSNFQINISASLRTDIRKMLNITGGSKGGDKGIGSQVSSLSLPSAIPLPTSSSSLLFHGTGLRLPNNLFEAAEKEVRNLWRTGDFAKAVKSEDETNENPLVKFCREMIHLSQPLNDFFKIALLHDTDLHDLQEKLTLPSLLPPDWASSWNAVSTTITK